VVVILLGDKIALWQDAQQNPGMVQSSARFAYEGGILRRLVTPYVLVGIGAILLSTIGTALATSFGGPENDGKPRTSLQEDPEETSEESETTLEEVTTNGTDKKADKARKSSRKSEQANKKVNKAQKAGNKSDRQVARAGKDGNS
jgi:hypothetical protein